MDFLERFEQIGHRLVEVCGSDDIRNVFRHIRFDEPRAIFEFGNTIGEVGRDDCVENALFIRFVELLYAFGKEGESRGQEHSLCALLFYFFCKFDDAVAGGYHIVRHENVHAHDGASDIFVRYDRISAVDYVCVVATFVEHTEVKTENGRIVDVSADCAFVGSNAHKAVLVEFDVGEMFGQGFQHLIGREIVVESHKRNRIHNSRIVCVESDEVGDSHLLEFLKHNRAIERFTAGTTMLSARVKHRHNHGDTIRFCVCGADDTFEVREMLVGSHRDLLSEEVVSDAVIHRVAYDVEVLASDRLHNHTLSVTARETRAIRLDKEGAFLYAHLRGSGLVVHLHEAFVDEFGKFLCAGRCNYTEGCCGCLVKK